MSTFPAHGANRAWAEQTYGIAAAKFVDFSSNVNPLGPPAAALAAAGAALMETAHYPEPQAESLKTALAAFLGAEPSGLMLGNGSSELIHLLCHVRRPQRVIVAAPAFGEYERAAAAAGAEVIHVHLKPEDDFVLRPDELAELALAADLTFFCNPGSPSGRLYERRELMPILEACRARGATLIMDESFMGFCQPDLARSATLLPETVNGGLVIISTLTKLFALAGLRGPGYLVTTPPVIAQLEDKAPPWRVNVVATAAARAALSDTAYLEQTRRLIPAWRKELHAGLEALRIFRIFPSSTNYSILRLEKAGAEAGALADALGHRGILVRDCRNFAGLDERFLRVAVRPPEEAARLTDELRAITTTIMKSKG